MSPFQLPRSKITRIRGYVVTARGQAFKVKVSVENLEISIVIS